MSLGPFLWAINGHCRWSVGHHGLVGLCQLALAFVGWHWSSLACFGLCWLVLAFVGRHWSLLVCAGLCWSLVVYTVSK
jgi:hypothetical protein